MLIHTTRHAQPGPGSPSVPGEDPVLTDLGREQAARLGQKLSRIGLQGSVYSSPYRRTLETADIIAAQINAAVYPERALQEWIPTHGKPRFRHLTIEQIQKLYERVPESAGLPDEWLFEGPENERAVQVRLKPFIDQLIATGQDVLLVGHGASVDGCRDLLLSEAVSSERTEWGLSWNCGLTTYEIDKDGNAELLRLNDVEHLLQKMITSNSKFLCELS